jgi:hypothetical protein
LVRVYRFNGGLGLLRLILHYLLTIRSLQVNKLSIEYVALESLRPHPGNPKDHDIDAIIESIKRFGYRVPMDPNQNTESSILVAGHGRREALMCLYEGFKAGVEEVPEGILNTPEGWLVPVLGGTKPLTPEEAEAFILADNQIQMNGPMQSEKLTTMLAKVSKTAKGLFGTGFLTSAAEASKALQKPSAPRGPMVPSSPEGCSALEAEEKPSARERALPPTPNVTGLKPIVVMFSSDAHLEVSGALEIIGRDQGLFGNKEVLVYLINMYLSHHGKDEILK